MTMRILLVLGTSGGGVGRHVRDLAKAFVAEGHSVLIAGPQSTQDSLDLTATGARFVAVPIAERPSPTGDPRSIRTIRRLAQKADVVHAHGLRAGALAAISRGRHRHPPLVVTLHNAPGRGGVALVYSILESIVAKRADLVLCVSPDLEERLRRKGVRRVGPAVVAAPTLAAPSRSVEQTRAELGLGPTTQLVVSVARLAEQKGLPLLLDAAELLRDAMDDLLIVVAGDGPSKPVLQQRIDDYDLPVRLLGWRDDVADLLVAADVAVSSAVWEGQPLWIQEALALGCAIVATDVGGTAQVVGDAASLVPAGDPIALADAIEHLLHDHSAREQLQRRAAQRAGELPDGDVTRDAALAAYAVLRVGT
jgi:glycosyltransferase involved in cell wall biosynthesis